MSRIRLKVLNSTDYSTRDLRRLFLAGMRAIGAEQPKTLVVKYRRSNSSLAGRAMIGVRPHAWTAGGVEQQWTPRIEGARVWLFLSRDGYHPVDEVARVILHELWHALGWRHREMPKDRTFDVSWAEGLPLRFKAPRRARPELQGVDLVATKIAESPLAQMFGVHEKED